MSNTDPPRPKAESTPNLRALLAVVIFMGILMVGVTIANRLGSMGDDEASAVHGFQAADIPIPAGCEILEARSDESRLIVRLGSGGRCNQVVIVDLESGAVAGRLN